MAANTSNNARTGTIILVGGQTITVTQQAAATPPPNTPVGENTSVPAGDVTLTFANVTGVETTTAIKTDVSAAKDVERMVAHAVEAFGRLDYAVNNAGIEGQWTGITDLAEDEWDRVLNINLKGTFLCMKYEARAMLDCGHGGAKVNIGSVNSFLGFPTGSAYVASKHGLIGLTTSVSAELTPQGSE